RSGRAGANLGGLLIAFIAILGLLNYLGYRYHKRFDLTPEGLYTLSDQSKKILSGLPKDVRVIKFDKVEDQALSDQMTVFKNQTSRLTYERIDPQQKPDLARQFNVQRMGETVIVSGERIERPHATSEQDLINAIMKVTRDQLKTVCFISGHGERDIADAEAEGYQAIDKALQNENYQTRSINLVTENQVPADCSVIVLSGPKKALIPQEVGLISKFLDEGGKGLIQIDPDTDPGVTDILKSWNVELGKDTVIDVSGVGRLFGTGPAVPLVGEYGNHPITKDMKRTATFFPLARSVKKYAGERTDITQVELLKTSERSWGETALKGDDAKFDEGQDTEGPVTLGITSTRKIGEKEARLVVIGDSDFANNNYVRLAGNGDLFLNTINWLAQEEDLISIRPKSATNRSVTMTESQQRTFFLLVVLIMPLAVIGIGAYVWWKRR
ncbi:MAG: GldG family protein, partial [Acidobacteriota bacterium]